MRLYRIVFHHQLFVDRYIPVRLCSQPGGKTRVDLSEDAGIRGDLIQHTHGDRGWIFIRYLVEEFCHWKLGDSCLLHRYYVWIVLTLWRMSVGRAESSVTTSS